MGAGEIAQQLEALAALPETPELELQAVVSPLKWVLRIHVKSSARILYTLKCLAISPALKSLRIALAIMNPGVDNVADATCLWRRVHSGLCCSSVCNSPRLETLTG